MPLAAGQSLTHYEILGPLGAGAMGEVYRARDTRLDREVAIKVLPEHFAEDEERLRRFEREAKSLASLNHPNVAQVFGIDQVGDTCFMAMELVPGETLEDRIARGAIPVDEVVDVCRQIAEGLEAAHEAGVIHRDLKPANVRVTPDRKVKVLDFGLAKPTGPEAESGSTVDSVLATEEGRLLGTPTYMAPEQARGRPIDRRVDVWAFGCLLFECLTSERAFRGQSVTDVLASIVGTTPDWSLLPGSTPTHVRRLLRRCLDKDPRTRLQDVGEARIALEAGDREDEMPRAQPRRVGFLAGTLACTLAGIAAGFWAGRLGHVEDRPSAIAGVVPTAFKQVSDLPGPERQPSLAPDGKSLVYVTKSTPGNADIYLQRVEGRTPINLTPDSEADDTAPAISPDGELIAFRSERAGGGIFVMGATGESVRRVVDFGFDPAWSPDGRELAVTTEPVNDPSNREYISELWVVAVDGSRKRRLTEGDAVGACWSPDGGRIAYWGWREPDWQRDLFTIAADGSEEQGILVTDDPAVDWTPAWSPDGGSLLFSSNRGGTMNLWRIDVDPATGRALDEAVPLTLATSWAGNFSISADGRRLAYATRDEQTDVLTVDFDPVAGEVTGALKPIFGGRAIEDLDWSPDAERLVISQSGEPWESLAIIRADGSGYTRITDASIQHRGVTWQPVRGSERILFYSNANLMTLRSDGSDVRMVEPGVHSFGGSWSADGRQVLTNDVRDDWEVGGFRKYELEDDGTFRLLDWEAPRFSELQLNGLDTWDSEAGLALTSGTVRRPGLYLIDLATGETSRLLESTQGISSGVFLPDGKRVLFKWGNRISLIDTVTREERLLLEIPQDTAGAWSRGMALSVDGKRLAILARRDEGDIWVVDLQDRG